MPTSLPIAINNFERIERQLGYEGLEYYQVGTEEGHVSHIFWAWREPDGERPRRFWISQEWLSAQWEALHGVPIVWIKAYKADNRSRNRLSRYVISQYVQDQSGYVNMCWSGNGLSFPHRHDVGRDEESVALKMSTDEYANRSRSLESSFSRLGKIFWPVMPFGSTAPSFCSCWARVSCGVTHNGLA